MARVRLPILQTRISHTGSGTCAVSRWCEVPKGLRGAVLLVAAGPGAPRLRYSLESEVQKGLVLTTLRGAELCGPSVTWRCVPEEALLPRVRLHVETLADSASGGVLRAQIEGEVP
jgi:hypothetical protein